MLFVLFKIINQYVVFTSTSYPLEFFIANILTGFVGFLVLGILFAVIWENWMEPKMGIGVRELKAHVLGAQECSISTK
jgi:hypothetical protein